MIRHLSIDIETFSSVDIKKAGAYRYVQSPDFQIMLIAFAWDDQPVHLIDLINNPKHILSADVLDGGIPENGGSGYRATAVRVCS